MTELFDTAVTSLLHLPEVLDRLAAADGDRRSGGHHAAHHHGPAHRVHGLGGAGGGAPVDIVETPGEYTFVLDVPGLSKSDIQVTLEEERVLVMKGGNGKRKREEEEDGEGCRYIRLERGASPRSFARKFRLPEDADTGGVAARCENGVLTVTVKKLPPPEKKTNSVQVTSSTWNPASKEARSWQSAACFSGGDVELAHLTTQNSSCTPLDLAKLDTASSVTDMARSCGAGDLAATAWVAPAGPHRRPARATSARSSHDVRRWLGSPCEAMLLSTHMAT